jgi:hypothetical protein
MSGVGHSRRFESHPQYVDSTSTADVSLRRHQCRRHRAVQDRRPGPPRAQRLQAGARARDAEIDPPPQRRDDFIHRQYRMLRPPRYRGQRKRKPIEPHQAQTNSPVLTSSGERRNVDRRAFVLKPATRHDAVRHLGLETLARKQKNRFPVRTATDSRRLCCR